MPRLVTRPQIAGWAAVLSAGVEHTARAQHATLGASLRSHGLGWSTPTVEVPAAVWNQEAWATAVNAHLAPAARTVATAQWSAMLRRLPTKASWGAAAPVDQLVVMVLTPALAAGPSTARRVGSLTAALTPEQVRRAVAAAPDRYGGVVHPEAQQTVADAYASAIDQLNTLVERVAGQMSNAAQAILAQTVDRNQPDPVLNVWATAGDDRVRADHLDVDGQTQRPGDPFDVGGEQLLYPGDPSGSDENTCNCRCVDGRTVVDWSEAMAVTRRWYEGEAVTVYLASGDHLTATPNHPVLTRSGWVPIGVLDEGDEIIHGDVEQRARLVDPDVERRPAPISEVFEALAVVRAPHRMRTSPVDFYGDATDGEVDVVAVDDRLALGGNPTGAERSQDLVLAASHRSMGVPGRDPARLPVLEPDQVRLARGSQPSARLGDDPLDGEPRHAQPGGDRGDGLPGVEGAKDGLLVERDSSFGAALGVVVGRATGGSAGDSRAESGRAVEQAAFVDDAAHAFGVGASDLGGLGEDHPAGVETNGVLHAVRHPFRGWVYDLMTASGGFAVHGAILHNCWLESIGGAFDDVDMPADEEEDVA